MFFGPQKSEDIAPERLASRIDELFDKKIEKFASKAGKISGQVSAAKVDFLDACERFDRLNVEPRTDYNLRFTSNANYIVIQKKAYAAALKRAVEKEAEVKRGTSYARLEAQLTALEAAINEVLKTNANFKSVMASYSNHLEGMKRSFSRLQGLAADFRAEMGNIGREVGEYTEVMGHAIEFSTLLEEVHIARLQLESLRSSPPSMRSRAANADEAHTAMKKKQEELGALSERLGRASSDVETLLSPLGKAARLYDHASPRKAKLSEFLANPLETLAGQEHAHEFEVMLSELYAEIEAGRVGVKDAGKVLSQIKAVKAAGLYEKASAYHLLEGQRRDVEEEIKSLDRIIDDVNAESKSLESHAKAVKDIEELIKSKQSEIQREKADIERLLLAHYKRKVSLLVAS